MEAKVTVDKLDPKTCVLNVEIDVSRQFWVRLYVAKLLLRLGARILNCGIEIKDK